MAVKKIEIPIGMIGCTMYYHTIYFDVEDKIHPKHKNKSVIKSSFKSQNSLVHKIHFIYRKFSKNYEGVGKNFIRR